MDIVNDRMFVPGYKVYDLTDFTTVNNYGTNSVDGKFQSLTNNEYARSSSIDLDTGWLLDKTPVLNGSYLISLWLKFANGIKHVYNRIYIRYSDGQRGGHAA